MIIFELSQKKDNEPQIVRISKIKDNKTEHIFTENRSFSVVINDKEFFIKNEKNEFFHFRT